jgi:hypothetical protein
VPVVPSRRQYGDPASLHLRRRPHPLPGAAWLDDTVATGDVLPARFAVPGIGPRVELLRVTVPPGATRMAVEVHGELLGVLLDGEPLEPAPEMPLPRSGHGRAPGRRTAELRILTIPGHQAGAALAGPVRFTMGPGTIELGDWEDRGLAGYSGAVRYRRRVDLPSVPAAAVLDLGRVRGTVEVTVNGVHAGVRICAPYRFDLGTALRDGPNDIEILVCGTLAPYLDEVSPTHFVFPGQRVSGLFGPVRLLMPTDEGTSRRPADPPP